MILLQEKYAELIYDKYVPCLIIRWKGYVKSSDFRSFIERSIEEYKKWKIIQPRLELIGDTTLINVISNYDQEWMNTYSNRKLYEAGLRHIAVLHAESVLGESSVKTFVHQTRHASCLDNSGYRVNIRVFKNLEDAKEWLREVQEEMLC